MCLTAHFASITDIIASSSHIYTPVIFCYEHLLIPLFLRSIGFGWEFWVGGMCRKKTSPHFVAWKERYNEYIYVYIIHKKHFYHIHIYHYVPRHHRRSYHHERKTNHQMNQNHSRIYRLAICWGERYHIYTRKLSSLTEEKHIWSTEICSSFFTQWSSRICNRIITVSYVMRTFLDG